MENVLSLIKSGDCQPWLQASPAGDFELESWVQSLGLKKLLVVSLSSDLACKVTAVLTIS